MRVLVVEDDKTFCQFLVEVLEDEGMDVEWTTDGLKAYEMSAQHDYDLFISDVRMPSILGTELAERIKRNDPNAKILLISAFAEGSVFEAASRLGIPVLSKPFGPAHLRDAIAQTVGP